MNLSRIGILLVVVLSVVSCGEEGGLCDTSRISESDKVSLAPFNISSHKLPRSLPDDLIPYKIQTTEPGEILELRINSPPVDMYIGYRDSDGDIAVIERDDVPVLYNKRMNHKVSFCELHVKTLVLLTLPHRKDDDMEEILERRIRITVIAFEGGHEQQLYNKLMANYNTKVRPVWNVSDPVNVSLQITLNQIVEIDERDQVLTTNLWIEQHWTDYKLVWDIDEFFGINELRIPATEIWVPDVTLYDNADSNDYVAHSRSSNAIVEHTGQIHLWSKPTVVKSTCKIDVKYFPFDMQACKMKFGSWTYTKTQMNLSKHTNAPDRSELVENEQWSLEYATTRRNVVKYECCPELYPDVTFHFGLKRKPLYYIYNLLMPCMLLSALSLLGFFMPYDVGVVKVSLSITLILSLTVFLLLVAEMMPRTSEEVPLIGQYYAATMFMISISTAMNVFVLNINEKGGSVHAREVPRWLRRIALEYLAVFFWVTPCPCNASKKRDQNRHEQHELRYKPGKNPNTHIVTFDSNSPRNGSVTSNHVVDNNRYRQTPPYDPNDHENETISERRLARMERASMEILKHLKSLERKKEKATQLKKEWALVAKVLDRLLLIIFLFSTITTTITLLSQRPPDTLPPPETE